MAYNLPLIAETQFANYISNAVSGTYSFDSPTGTEYTGYNVINGFRVAQLTAPCVIASTIGTFTELEPQTHVYIGTLTFGVLTPIDFNEPEQMHDATLSQVYEAMAQPEAVSSGVNAENFHLWGYYLTEYENGIGEGEHYGRMLTSKLTFQVYCQNSGVS